MKKYIGIDIGGTAIKAGIIAENGEVLYRMLEPTPPLGSTSVFADIIWKVAEDMKIYSQSENIEIAGIGVSSAGQINTQTGSVMGACGNIPNWVGTPLKEKLEEIFNLPVTAANDANCALLAECWIGGGKGYKNVIAYTIGTGIGGGILVDGKLLTGQHGIAGELGHFIIQRNGLPCTCGNKGCFEQYGSMTALVRKIEKLSGRQKLNGKIILEEMDQGNPLFQECWEEFLEIHADAIVGLVHLFNPEIVIIGGGISSIGEELIAPIRQAVLNKAMPAFTQHLTISTAHLRNDAGIIGAVKNFMDIHKN